MVNNYLMSITMSEELLNSSQIIMLRQLKPEIADDKLQLYRKYLELERNENGESQPKDVSDRVSIKVYVHKQHRELLNDYCSITGQSVSALIRELTLQHIQTTVEKYS